TQAARRAAGADAILDAMRVVRTLPEALEDCVDVVMTTGRAIEGSIDPRETAQRLLSAGGECALVFGDEVNGLPAVELRRANALATIPTADKSSLNLAQAVMVFGYEILLASKGPGPLPTHGPELANERLLGLFRGRAFLLPLVLGAEPVRDHLLQAPFLRAGLVPALGQLSRLPLVVVEEAVALGLIGALAALDLAGLRLSPGDGRLALALLFLGFCRLRHRAPSSERPRFLTS